MLFFLLFNIIHGLFYYRSAHQQRKCNKRPFRSWHSEDHQGPTFSTSTVKLPENTAKCKQSSSFDWRFIFRLILTEDSIGVHNISQVFNFIRSVDWCFAQMYVEWICKRFPFPWNAHWFKNNYWTVWWSEVEEEPHLLDLHRCIRRCSTSQK